MHWKCNKHLSYKYDFMWPFLAANENINVSSPKGKSVGELIELNNRI